MFTSSNTNTQFIEQKNASKLIKKALVNLSPVKKHGLSMSNMLTTAEKRSLLYKKSMSTGNLIENELIKYRRQNEKIEAEEARKLVAREKLSKSEKVCYKVVKNIDEVGAVIDTKEISGNYKDFDNFLMGKSENSSMNKF